MWMKRVFEHGDGGLLSTTNPFSFFLMIYRVTFDFRGGFKFDPITILALSSHSFTKIYLPSVRPFFFFYVLQILHFGFSALPFCLRHIPTQCGSTKAAVCLDQPRLMTLDNDDP